LWTGRIWREIESIRAVSEAIVRRLPAAATWLIENGDASLKTALYGQAMIGHL
jgi:hypothetical protein